MMAAGNHTLIAVDADALQAALPVSMGAVRSTRVFKGAGASIVRLTFDEGAVVREHTAAAPILLQALSGHVDVAGAAVELWMHLGPYLRFFANHALPVQTRTGGLPLGSLWSDIESLMVDDGAPASKSATQCECGIVDQPSCYLDRGPEAWRLQFSAVPLA